MTVDNLQKHVIYILQQCSNSKASLILGKKKIKKNKKEVNFLPFYCVSFKNFTIWQALLTLTLHREKLCLCFFQSILFPEKKSGENHPHFLPEKTSILYSFYANCTISSSIFSAAVHILIPKTAHKKIEQWGFFDVTFWSDFRNSNNYVVRPAS